MKKLSLFIFLFILGFTAFAQKYYTLDQIPDPKKNGQDYFVSDPDGYLNNTDSLNRLIAKLEKQTKVEMAVVAVGDFDQEQEDFDFATALFNKWGIGKKGSNNGLLLFISVDRRKYRFISGYGIEGLLPDVTLKHIGENNLVPAFKRGEYSEGVLQAVNKIYDILTDTRSRDEINSLIAQQKQKDNAWKYNLLYAAVLVLLFGIVFRVLNRQAPKLSAEDKKKKTPYDSIFIKGCVSMVFITFALVFLLVFGVISGWFDGYGWKDVPPTLYILFAIVLFFSYTFQLGNLRKLYNDDKNFIDQAKAFQWRNWWMLLFSPLIVIMWLKHLRLRSSTGNRFAPVNDSKGQAMMRVDRDENISGAPYLTEGQRKEEISKVYDYDIWLSHDRKEHLIKQWPAEEYEHFSECPVCHFKTFSEAQEVTVKKATYTTEGQAKEIRKCANCKHEEFIKWVTLAMLVRQSSSSSGGSGSSGGSSSSSSSSGSWGGGSSGGGGAGGSW